MLPFHQPIVLLPFPAPDPQGKYDFVMEESEDGRAVVLDIALPKFLDTSLVKVDVQPTYIRLLIKGRLLQLVIPEEARDRPSRRRCCC